MYNMCVLSVHIKGQGMDRIWKSDARDLEISPFTSCLYAFLRLAESRAQNEITFIVTAKECVLSSLKAESPMPLQ